MIMYRPGQQAGMDNRTEVLGVLDLPAFLDYLQRYAYSMPPIQVEVEGVPCEIPITPAVCMILALRSFNVDVMELPHVAQDIMHHDSVIHNMVGDMSYEEWLVLGYLVYQLVGNEG